VIALGLAAVLALAFAFWQGAALWHSPAFLVLLAWAVAFEGLSVAIPRYGYSGLGFVVCFAALARPPALYDSPQPGLATALAGGLLLSGCSLAFRGLFLDRHEPWSRLADTAVNVLRMTLAGLAFLAAVRVLDQGRLELFSLGTALGLGLAGLVHRGVDWLISARTVALLEGEEAGEEWIRIYSRYGILMALGLVSSGYLVVLVAQAALQLGAMSLVPALALGCAVAVVPALLLRALLRYGIEAADSLTEEKERMERDLLRSQQAAAQAEEQNTRLNADLKRTKDELQLLYDMDRELGGASRLEEALDIVLKMIRRLRLPHQSCVVFMLGKDGPYPARAVTPYLEVLEMSSLLQLREGLVSSVLEHGRPQLASETAPAESRIFKDERSALCVPMIVARQVIGAIYLGDLKPGSLTSQHLQTVASLANHAAPTLKVFRLLEDKLKEVDAEREVRAQLEAKNQQFAVLHQIGQNVGQALDLSRTAQVVIEGVGQMVPQAQSVILLLSQPDSAELRPICYRTPYEMFVKDLTLRQDEGLVGKAMEIRQALLIHDTRSYSVPNFLEYERSVIVAPLVYESEALGAIYVGAQSEDVFREDQRWLVETVSYQAGMAIKNARLYQQTRDQALHDGLTGLYTHRWFQVRLEEEIQSALRSSRPLCLVMVDTDNFKTYNDTLGHPEGDRLLKELAALLRENVRASDIVCRYGGDEFALILKDCPKEAAVETANRIRESVQLRFASHSVRITSSIGVACLPTDARTKKELTKAADDALYRSKRGGRNRVSVAPPLERTDTPLGVS
jgi:diguanylate cyclase (GGDEF)-like protein